MLNTTMTPSSRHHIPVQFVHAILHHIDSPALRASLLAQCGINEHSLNQPNQIISAEQLARLQTSVALALNDEMIGYAASPIPVGSWKIMSMACVNSLTLAELIKRYIAFYKLFPWGIQLDCNVNNQTTHFTLKPTSDNQFAPFLYESCLHNTHRFLSWMIDSNLPVTQVNLTYPKPTGSAYYRHILPFSVWRFEQAACEMVFPAKYLETPCQQNDISLKQFLRQPSFNLLACRFGVKNWSGKIRRLVSENLLSPPTFEELAQQLNIHPQTLRRRLLEEGTSYRDIKNSLRGELAKFYLRNPGFSMEDIAEKVGFSEPSSFLRAFKSWTGITPQMFRDQ